MRFEEIEKGIFLLKVSFDNIFTSVFAVCEGEEIALIDTATTEEDVTTYILPALEELSERVGGRLSYILLTHSHGDHAGGAPFLAKHFKGIPVCAYQVMELPSFRQLRDGEILMDRLEVVHLPGHTPSSVGYLDRSSGILLSGDCLQLLGVGKYTRGVSDRDAYFASVDRLLERGLEGIIASHEYEPLGSRARGREETDNYLKMCKSLLQ